MRPTYIQKLQHDKALCKSTTPQFVDTWNYMTERLENIKGDRDTNPQDGHITFDTSDPEHPVIRFQGDANQEAKEDGVVSLIGQNTSEEVKGHITIQGKEGSGLEVTSKVTSTDEPGYGTLEVDVANRLEDEEFAPREVTIEEEVIAKVFATTDFEITQKKILAGDGIEIEDDEDGNIIVSTSLSCLSEGYTGERNVLVDVDYHDHQLRKKFAIETWENGILKSTEEQAWETYHTAVEETT